MSVEQQRQVRFEGIKKLVRKTVLPVAVGAGVLFPTTVYADALKQDGSQARSEEVSNFLDNRQIEIIEGVTLLAGVAATLNGHYRGRKYDENRLHALRVAGPALLTVAVASALIDSQVTIPYVIPSGLALAGTYGIGATGIIDTFERTRDKAIQVSTVAASAGIVAAGATIFLAVADKL